MSNSELIIAERSRDIGDFLVGRLIPFRKKRMVGPFIFIDHMGPSEIAPGHYMDIGRHPHIGLSTLTYLLEGEMLHTDSLGTEQLIAPGSVNWMTAGKGVTHAERTPTHLKDGQKHRMHGYQIWVALPKDKEFMAPSFYHLGKDELPRWEEDGADFTLIAGKGFGHISPLPVYSDLFMAEIKTETPYELNIQGQLEGEIGICIVSGGIYACNERVEAGNMLVSKVENTCQIIIDTDSHILLFGGQPFPEERFIHWNFVASDKETLEQAKADWKADRFPKIDGDDSYIPMP